MEQLFKILALAILLLFVGMNCEAHCQVVAETVDDQNLKTDSKDSVVPAGSYMTYLKTFGGIKSLRRLSRWRLVFTTKMREDANNLTIKVTACRDGNKVGLTIENSQLGKPIYVGTNGTKHWIDSPVDQSVGGGKRFIELEEFESHFLDVALLLPNFGHVEPIPFEILDSEKIGKQEFDLIKFKPTTNQVVVGLVDKSTGRLSRIRYTQKHRFGETKFQSFYSEFNTPGSISSVAKKHLKATNSIEFETNIERFELEPKFDNGLFVPLKEILDSNTDASNLESVPVQDQKLLQNEIYILTMSSRFKGRNDIYRSMLLEEGPEFYEKQRPIMLLTTVISTYIFLNLEVSQPPVVLRPNYRSELLDTSLDASLLLELNSPEKFHEKLKTKMFLVRLYEESQDYKFAAKILDPKTGELLPEFRKYLETLYSSQ